MRRTPIPPHLFSQPSFELTPELERYLLVVLRLQEGASFVGFNGEGEERAYVLSHDEAWSARATSEPTTGRTGAPLTLCYGVPKGEKLDLVARQLTELGVGSLALWAASRSVSVWKPDKAPQKLKRLEKVTHEAARQCGRADTLTLSPPAPLRELIARFSACPLKLYLDPRASLTLSELRALTSEQTGALSGELLAREGVVAIIGPEGGLSPDELCALDEAGWRGLALGSPVLRTETAATVTAALLLEVFGWL